VEEQYVLPFLFDYQANSYLQHLQEVQSNIDPAPEPPPLPPINSTLRDRLREWEKEHAASYVMAPMVRETNLSKGAVLNNTTRPQPGSFEIEEEEDEYDNSYMAAPLFDRGELVDVGNQRTFLLPGDMVELLYVEYWGATDCIG
jgi:hypothetical protein